MKIRHFITIKQDITTRRRVEETLCHKNQKLSIMHEIALELLNQHPVDELPQVITDQFVKLLDADVSYINLREGEDLVDRAITPKEFRYEMYKNGVANNPVWQVYESKQPVVVDNLSALPNTRPHVATLGIKAALFLPILNGEVCLGVLGAGRFKSNHPFGEDDISFGKLFAKLAALALDNAQLHEALHQETIHDPLTGLFNRRFMEERVVQELHRAERNSSSLVLVMMDLDHFKNLNDSYGHDAGDEALRQLALLLKTHFRDSDVVCRYGGEEFVMILPDTSLPTSIDRMEQLRQEIKRLAIHYDMKAGKHLSASFGIAVYPQHGSTGQQLLKAADEALYRAKQSGRDTIVSR